MDGGHAARFLNLLQTTHACDITFIKGNKETYSEDLFINLWKGGWLFMDEDNTIIGYV